MMKLTVKEAAVILEDNPENVRVGMSQGTLDIGYVTQRKRRVFSIQSAALARHMNVAEQVIVTIVLKMRDEKKKEVA